jgi:hypothetical protein
MLKRSLNFIIPNTDSDSNPFPHYLLPFLITFKILLAVYLVLFEPHAPLPQFTGPEGHEFSPKIIIVLDLILGGLLYKLTRQLTNSDRAAYRAIHLWHISPIVIFPAYLGYAPSLFPLALTITSIFAALYGFYWFSAIFLALSCVYSTPTIIFVLPILLILAKDVRISLGSKILMLPVIGSLIWLTLVGATRPLILTHPQFQALASTISGPISVALQFKIAFIVGLAVVFFSQGPQQRERPAIALTALCSLCLVDISAPSPAELPWTVPFWLILISEFHSSKTVFSGFYLCGLIYLGIFIGATSGALPASALSIGTSALWGGLGAVACAWIRGDR